MCTRVSMCMCVYMGVHTCVHVCGCQQPHVKSGREQEEERVRSGGRPASYPALTLRGDRLSLSFQADFALRLCSDKSGRVARCVLSTYFFVF